MPMQWAAIQLRQLYTLHNPILHALIQHPNNRHTQAQTNSKGASLQMFHINLHSVTITSDTFKQNFDKHILNVLQPFTQNTIAQSLQWLSYDLNDRGIMVRFPIGTRGFSLFSETPRLALGPRECPLRLSCALCTNFPQLFSLRATRFARLILFIVSSPLWPQNRCVRCGVTISSRHVPPATTHLPLDRRQLLQDGSRPPAEPPCTCASTISKCQLLWPTMQAHQAHLGALNSYSATSSFSASQEIRRILQNSECSWSCS
jgi:hypothetical protein